MKIEVWWLHVGLVRLVQPRRCTPREELGGGRARRSYGIFAGLVLLVLYQKILQFGGSMAALGHISPWLGLWLPLMLFAAASAALFAKASAGGLANPVDGIMERLARAPVNRDGVRRG